MKDSIQVATPNATKAVSKTTAKWEKTPEIDIIKELTFIDPSAHHNWRAYSRS